MNSLFRKADLKNILGLLCISFGTISTIVLANSNPDFKLTVTPGTLGVDIVNVNSNYHSISDPIFIFNPIQASTECKSGANSAGMVLGSDFHDLKLESYGGNIYISNPDAADDGFTVSIAATDGDRSTWYDSVGNNVLDFNANDCSSVNKPLTIEGVTNLGGRMYVNPSVAILSTGKCGTSCTTNGLSLGSANHFEYNNIGSITLLQADASADNVADYVINGINVSQTIPAMVSAGNYSLGMTMSVISNGGTVISGPVITYSSQNVSNGDIYTSTGGFTLDLSSSDPLTTWSTNYSGGDRSMSTQTGPEVHINSMPTPYVSPENVIYTATGSNGGVTNVTVHFGTGKYCGGNVWVSNSATCPSPKITYNGTDVSNGDVYVDRCDFSTAITLTSASGSLLNWSYEGDYGAYSISNSDLSSSAKFYSMGDINYIEAKDVVVRATNPDDNTYSLVNIHFGTGQYCPNTNEWISNSATCSI